MKIIITESQLKNIINEQNSVIDYIKNTYNKLTGKEKKVTPSTPQKQSNLPFTPENFAKFVKEIGITHPDIAIAQAMIESGHFKSNLFQKNNNVFGMKFARQRSTTALGPRYGQAYYKDWMESVKDYKLWQEARQLKNLSKEEYLNKLDKIYCIPPSCGAQNYSKKVKQLLPRANTLITKS